MPAITFHATGPQPLNGQRATHRGALSAALLTIRRPYQRLAVVVDDLDVVPVGIEHERGVVPVVVVGPLAGLAVALIAGRNRVGVTPAHRVVVAGEGDVDVLGRLAGEHPEHTTGSADREPRTLRGLAADRQPCGRARRRVERG